MNEYVGIILEGFLILIIFLVILRILIELLKPKQRFCKECNTKLECEMCANYFLDYYCPKCKTLKYTETMD